jgi:hypothetical protein
LMQIRPRTDPGHSTASTHGVITPSRRQAKGVRHRPSRRG